MQNFILALDLHDQPDLIQSYIDYHQKVWPEVVESLRDAGIQKLEIFHIADRLIMIVEADNGFSWEKKAKYDAVNTKVQEWEELMGKFQKPLEVAKPGEKWVLMDKIYDLDWEKKS